MNEATTIRTYLTYDTDIKTGEVEVVSASTEPPTLGPPVVRDTGKRVFQCAERPADTIDLCVAYRKVQVSANDGARTANVYLTREAAYELGAALFALADTLRA